MASSEQVPKYSEPSYAKDNRAKTDYPWYLTNIDKYLLPETKQLLEIYSKIPPSEQSKHVHEIRDRAWAIRTYPCTGLGAFLAPFISRSAAYPSILERLQAGDTFMDMGCFLGCDMRRLVFDGAPSENMIGVDIVSHWDVGYDLFRDQDRIKAKFIEADILGNDEKLLEWEGKMDIISISAVLHQWTWKAQIKAAKQVVRFSKKGALVVGYQVANLESKEVVTKGTGVPVWRHNVESWKKMWETVSEETGTVWEAEGWLRTWPDFGWDPEDSKWMEEGIRLLDFVVTRIK